MSDHGDTAGACTGQSAVHLAGDVVRLDGAGGPGDHTGHLVGGLGYTGPVTTSGQSSNQSEALQQNKIEDIK